MYTGGSKTGRDAVSRVTVNMKQVAYGAAMVKDRTVRFYQIWPEDNSAEQNSPKIFLWVVITTGDVVLKFQPD